MINDTIYPIVNVEGKQLNTVTLTNVYLKRSIFHGSDLTAVLLDTLNFFRCSFCFCSFSNSVCSRIAPKK